MEKYEASASDIGRIAPTTYGALRGPRDTSVRDQLPLLRDYSHALAAIEAVVMAKRTGGGL